MYEEQYAQINESKRQLESQRQQLDQQRQDLKRQRQQFTQPAKRQRFTSRNERGAREQYLKDLDLSEKSLDDYEQQLKASEQEIQSYEKQLQEIERDKLAFKRAEELFRKRVPATFVEDAATRVYLKQFYKANTTYKITTNAYDEKQAELAYKAAKANIPKQPTKTELELGMSLPPELRNQSTRVVKGLLPTYTEQQLKMSLPENLRDLSPAQIKQLDAPKPKQSSTVRIASLLTNRNAAVDLYTSLERKKVGTKTEVINIQVIDENGRVVGNEKVVVPVGTVSQREQLFRNLQGKTIYKKLTGSQEAPLRSDFLDYFGVELTPTRVVNTVAATGLGAASIGGSALLSEAEQFPNIAKFLYGAAASRPVNYVAKKARTLYADTYLGDLLYGTTLGVSAALSPTAIGLPLAISFGSDIIKDPLKVAEETSSPRGLTSLAGGFIGGGIGKVAKTNIPKLSPYYVKPKVIRTPSGEPVKVIDVKTPKGDNVRVLLQEGQYSASEKLPVINQLRAAAEAEGKKFFVHVSPKPIPTTRINAKDYGIDVTIDRGLYLSPESQITYPGMTQASTFYGQFSGAARDIGLAEFLYRKAIKRENLQIAKSGRKGALILEREYPNMPAWIRESLTSEKLSPSSEAAIRRYAARFDEFNKGKTFKLPGKSGIYVDVTPDTFIKAVIKKDNPTQKQLLAAKAIYQWNIETQEGVLGGLELQPGLQPFGPESQLIEPKGKVLKKIPSGREKFYRFFGLERGRQFTQLGGDVLELTFFEEAPRSGKVGKVSKAAERLPDIDSLLVDSARSSRERTAERVNVRKPTIPIRVRAAAERRSDPASYLLDNTKARERPAAREQRPVPRSPGRERARLTDRLTPLLYEPPSRINERPRPIDNRPPRPERRDPRLDPRVNLPALVTTRSPPRQENRVTRSERPERKQRGEGNSSQGYDVFGIQDATNRAKRKQVKINKQPLTRAAAQDLLAYGLDNSISAQGSIRRAKGRAQRTQLPIAGYFMNNRDKFRQYRVAKGKRVPTPNTFYEKKGRRLDTRGEINKIQLAKAVASRNSRRSSGFRFF